VETQDKTVIDVARRKRIDRYKRIILMTVAAMIVIPAFLCVILFIKVCALQNQIDDLNDIIEQQSEYIDENSSSTETKEETTENLTEETTEEPTEEPTDDTVITATKFELEGPYGQWTIEQQQIIDSYTDKGDGHTIYLTFDDGPSVYTEEILDILDYYGVKATFFVNGRTDKNSLERYKLIAERGHTIGLHSYTHDYSDIYGSLEGFVSDLERISNLVYETTGVRSVYYRFPGGTSNEKTILPISTFITYLNENGYSYFDWNSTCGDGASKTVPMENIVTNVMKDAVRHKHCVALLHDAKSKRTTVDGLPLLIETLLNAGFQISSIDENTPLVQHRVVK